MKKNIYFLKSVDFRLNKAYNNSRLRFNLNTKTIKDDDSND